MDVFSKKKRSLIMAGIKSANTKPEMTVRSIVRSLGFRFSGNKKDLPGKPDIVMNKYKKVVFIHGCFWHGHSKCRRSTRPKTNKVFWNHKIDSNIKRDDRNLRALRKSGWKPLVIWECEIKDKDRIRRRLLSFVESKKEKLK